MCVCREKTIEIENETIKWRKVCIKRHQLLCLFMYQPICLSAIPLSPRAAPYLRQPVPTPELTSLATLTVIRTRYPEERIQITSIKPVQRPPFMRTRSVIKTNASLDAET